MTGILSQATCIAFKGALANPYHHGLSGMLEKERHAGDTKMTEMTDNTQQQITEIRESSDSTRSKKLSEEAIGMLLLFAAIPLIAYIKWNYDDHVALGAIASCILAISAIVLRKKFGNDE
jgi:preprotein translocase subunit SecF